MLQMFIMFVNNVCKHYKLIYLSNLPGTLNIVGGCYLIQQLHFEQSEWSIDPFEYFVILFS